MQLDTDEDSGNPSNCVAISLRDTSVIVDYLRVRNIKNEGPRISRILTERWTDFRTFSHPRYSGAFWGDFLCAVSIDPKVFMHMNG